MTSSWQTFFPDSMFAFEFASVSVLFVVAAFVIATLMIADNYTCPECNEAMCPLLEYSARVSIFKGVI